VAVRSSWRHIGAAALCLAEFVSPAGAAEVEGSGEVRLQGEVTSVNDAGPLAAANALVPGIVPIAGSGLRVEAQLRGAWHPASTRPWLSSLAADVLLAADRPQGGPTDNASRINELHAASDFGAWQLDLGKRIVSWDVSYGFRPNDVVQQERRRTLLPQTPEGRPLLELEHFGAEQAAALVWVNPNHAGEPDNEQRGASESALAARWYTRQGAADWHLFARWGEHTYGSVGAALAFVATDELELHASARALQRHDGWRIEPQAGNGPVTANPWAQATLGGTSQWLLGASWTGQQQQSLLLEYWYDGTTLSDEQWDRWMARNQGLAAFGALPGLPASLVRAAAGNLAWQATPFDTPNLRRDNLFVRLAWQPDHWLLSADALITPADRGRIVTFGVQWQGDRLRLHAVWRLYGGPAGSLFAQLPQRRVGVLAAAWAF
jgi:hypothetical protein